MEGEAGEGGGQLLIWKSELAPQSMVSITVGRVMNTVLSARSKKLRDAVSSLSPDHLHGASSLDSLHESLWFLHKYVRDAAQNNVTLDEILIPMIEHSLRHKNLKHGGQAMVLLDWLFQDEILFQKLAENLAEIIVRKEDRYVALGWCILVRALVEYQTATSQLPINGIRERHNDLLKIFSSHISRLSCVLNKGSCLQDGYELPSRLSVSAADCLLAFTNALTRKAAVQGTRQKIFLNVSNQPSTSALSSFGDARVKAAYKSYEDSSTDMEYLLWDHLEDLINLVHRLLAWSRKSRPLHAKGLEQVCKWLQEIKVQYGCIQDEVGLTILRTGARLLGSCWKHYSTLLFLEDRQFPQHYRQWLDQYLSGIQYYTGNHTGGSAEEKDGLETRKFFLNCLCLLLGRLDSKTFDGILSEYGTQISQVLLSQFNCSAEDIVDQGVFIFKALIFKTNLSSGSSHKDGRQMDDVLPSLLHLLDERDLTARAVVKLIAEYCSMGRDGQGLQEVLRRFMTGDVLQRRNAVDVVSELISILLSSNSSNVLSQSEWQDITNHLLDCLIDEEVVICEQAAHLLLKIEPSLVLPSLLGLVHSSDERVSSSASHALVEMLRRHNQKVEVIFMLLDSLSNLSGSVDLSSGDKSKVEESKLLSEPVLRLIPEWAQSVQDWSFLIGPLINKMLAEPSNATVVRFLSMISEHLAAASDEVLSRVLLHMKGQKEIDESFFVRRENRNYTSDYSVKLQQSLFERLCPLLLIRMLPLRVFDDLNFSVMYGELAHSNFVHDINIVEHPCVAAFLWNRAFSKLEFEDVRKLAAELCGRIHPQVLFPHVSSILEDAVRSRDILRAKACLFSICTSLMVRGTDPVLHPVLFEIIKTLEIMICWPSLDGDEVSKAQHGCIDCLALMICAELQAPNSVRVGKKGVTATTNDVLGYVIDKLVHGNKEVAGQAPIHLSFSLCMANVLISACQKISDSGKKPFAQKALPYLIRGVKEITRSEIRAACIQVFFSAVFHLKSAVLPYSCDLLKISLKAMKNGSEKEKMASAKLVASLMASEDSILESICEGLPEATDLLSTISSSDPSLELRQVCEKMLGCLISP